MNKNSHKYADSLVDRWAAWGIGQDPPGWVEMDHPKPMLALRIADRLDTLNTVLNTHCNTSPSNHTRPLKVYVMTHIFQHHIYKRLAYE